MNDTALTRKEFDTRMSELITGAQEMGLWDGGPLQELKARVTLAVRRQVANNPKLRECTPESIAGAALDAHLAGLLPDGREGYLIPRRNKKLGIVECHFLASWRGLQSIACEDGNFRAVTAQAVRERDDFTWREGLNPVLEHTPALNKPGRIIAGYAIGWPKDGSEPVSVVIDQDDIRAARATGGPTWKTHEAAMVRKTAVRRLTDRVIHSPTARSRLAHAIAGEDRMADAHTREAVGDRAAAHRAALMPPTPEEQPGETINKKTGEVLDTGMGGGVADAVREHQPKPVRSSPRPSASPTPQSVNLRLKALRKRTDTGESIDPSEWTALEKDAETLGMVYNEGEDRYETKLD